MTTIFKLFIKFFPIVFIIVFLFVLGVFIWSLAGVIKEKKQKADAPKLTVNAKVLSKRSRVIGGRNAAPVYCATFEAEGGDRLDLTVSEELFSGFSEGDEGRVTFRGGEFISLAK